MDMVPGGDGMSDSLKQQLAIEDANEGRVIPGWRASLVYLITLGVIIAARLIPQHPDDPLRSLIIIGCLWSMAVIPSSGLLDRYRRRTIG